MKPVFAHFAETAPATVAAAIGVALSLFLLAGLGHQGSPTPLLPAVGSAVGRVAADLPAPAKKHHVGPAHKAVVSVQLAAARPQQVVPQPRRTATSPHRAHRRPESKVTSRAPSVPVRVTAPVVPSAPVSTQRSVSAPTRAKGNARGHAHGRAVGHTHTAPAPRSHGHDKAPPGHSSEHHHGVGHGPAKNAPPVAPPAPVTPTGHGNGNGNGNGNGHKGGKK